MEIKLTEERAEKDIVTTISGLDRCLNELAFQFDRFWARAGRMESRVLRSSLDKIAIERPVFICGLARSGTTIALELLASCDTFGSNKYRDFPFVHIPYWWNHFLKHARTQGNQKLERAHRDGLLVNGDSPEALEEPFWNSYFDGLHLSEASNLLGEDHENVAFEKYYRDHIRKILLVRKKTRYLAKSNYSISRIPYLQRLFPDARFIIMVRHPTAHIASLCKQHELFCRLESENFAILKQMNYMGHYEFGLNRSPINSGNTEIIREIKAMWNAGEMVRGWALYWKEIYSYVLKLSAGNPVLRNSILWVKYEDLCEKMAVLPGIFSHVGVKYDPQFLQKMHQMLKKPSYYSCDYTDRERNIIFNEVGPLAKQLGFGI